MSLLKRTPVPVLRSIGRLARLLVKPANSRVVILTYHEVGVGLSIDLFQAQMDHLARHARVVDLMTAIKSADSTNEALTCGITFDDGYESVYTLAYPILRRLNFPATIYLNSGLIGESGPRLVSLLDRDRPAHMLNWNQVREMAANSVTMGSHLSEHGDLSVIDRAEAMRQLSDARRDIKSRLGRECVHFAYPFGRLSLESVSWVREAGHLSAVTMVNRRVRPTDDRLRLPRIGIEDRYNFDDFVGLVRGDWDYIGALQTLRRPDIRLVGNNPSTEKPVA
jgi:peptidoglycan/xylan/chitin deacetylase (PgdA/CDA1 family)